MTALIPIVVLAAPNMPKILQAGLIAVDLFLALALVAIHLRRQIFGDTKR